MTYTLVLTPQAQKHLEEWGKSGQKKTLEKIARLLEEITLHPTAGTGQVEQLRGNLSGFWSRRINKADRICQIENALGVEILQVVPA